LIQIQYQISDIKHIDRPVAVDIGVKGNLYCTLEVPSADSLHQENLAICVTKDGYVASTEEALLDQAVFLASSGDELAFSRFLDENPLVFILKGNYF